MNRQYLKKAQLPDSPGIYIFRDSRKKPLYIGRATFLADRVKSYFATDLIVTRGPRIVDMITKAKSITVQKTDSVLEAILLESALIKKYQLYYNVAERDDKSDQYVVITEEEWPRVFQVRARDFNQLQKTGNLSYKVKKMFGPFPQGGLIKEALQILRKLFPFRDRKANDARHDAFYRAIGMSPTTPSSAGRSVFVSLRSASRKSTLVDASTGVADDGLQTPIQKQSRDFADTFPRGLAARGDLPRGNVVGKVGETVFEGIESNTEYKKTIDQLILFFEGKKKVIQTNLKKEMKTYSDNREFEEANRIKKLLFALDHIRDIALLKRENNQSLGMQSNTYRIEAYDIAHLSGTNVVGAMTVSVGGELVKGEYRKFKISRQTNNDIAGLVEIISRRLNHTEWAYPDLIIVDGNEVHAKAAKAVLSARRINIPVVAVMKDDKHKAAIIIGSPDVVKSNKGNIIALNAEAHRFAISYHRSLRKL